MTRRQYYSSEAKLKSLKVPYDAYVTPEIAVKELLKREKFTGQGWEPAVGTGVIAKYFPGILTSDIRGEELGVETQDFLKASKQVDFIITNPPYCYQFEFVETALRLARLKVAMFLRLQFLESRQRYHLFQKYQPSKVYVFSNRLCCLTEDGKPTGVMIPFCWIIWDKNYKGPTILDWILSEDPNAKLFQKMGKK